MQKFKFAICQEGFRGWGFRRIVEFCRKVGYDGVELAPFMFDNDVRNITASVRREIRSTAEGHGLAITGLHWLLVKPEGLYINHTDPLIRRKTADYLKSLADFCADVGGKTMTLGSPKQRCVLPGSTPAEARQLALETLVEVGSHCAGLGEVLCIEPLPSGNTDFITTAREACELAADAASPGIAMMLDVKSMCSESGRAPHEIIRGCRGRFMHFHANDANLQGPGFGDVDFVPIFRALTEVGYEGYVSVEAFEFLPNPETAAIRSLGYMKECLC